MKWNLKEKCLLILPGKQMLSVLIKECATDDCWKKRKDASHGPEAGQVATSSNEEEDKAPKNAPIRQTTLKWNQVMPK